MLTAAESQVFLGLQLFHKKNESCFWVKATKGENIQKVKHFFLALNIYESNSQHGDFLAHLYHLQLDFLSLMRCKIQARAVFQGSIEEKTIYSVSNAFIMWKILTFPNRSHTLVFWEKAEASACSGNQLWSCNREKFLMLQRNNPLKRGTLDDDCPVW